MNKFFIAPLGLLVVAATLQAFNPQEPASAATTSVVVLPPQRTPYWDTFTLRNDVPQTLLVVPNGKRFVLTDLWTMDDYYLPGQASDKDRLLLEGVGRDRTRLVFESSFGSLPSPMTWETGPSFNEDSQVVLSYRFVAHDNNELVRQVHFTGYFEDVKPTSLGR